MPKLPAKLHYITELYDINEKIIPLKSLAERDRASIYGLTGMVYTPYIYDYMKLCVKKAAILACLKKQGIIEISEVKIAQKFFRLQRAVLNLISLSIYV